MFPLFSKLTKDTAYLLNGSNSNCAIFLLQLNAILDKCICHLVNGPEFVSLKFQAGVFHGSRTTLFLTSPKLCSKSMEHGGEKIANQTRLRIVFLGTS